jgi:hypothetical protein
MPLPHRMISSDGNKAELQDHHLNSSAAFLTTSPPSCKGWLKIILLFKEQNDKP